MRRGLALASTCVFLALAATACGDDAKPGPSTSSGSAAGSASGIEGLTVTENEGKPEVTVKGFDVSGPETAVISEGEGPEIAAGATALLNIHLVNGATGRQAYSTYDGEPLESKVTAEQLPGGLDKLLVGQQRGARVVLATTVTDGIGAEGAPEIGLEPNQDVVFVVDVMSVAPTEVLDGPEGDDKSPPDGAPVVLETDGAVTGFDFSDAAAKPADELQVITLIEGDGPAVPEEPRYVAFNYFGAVYGEKEPFDESYSRGVTPFLVGANKLIEGWDEALPGVKQGSRIMLIVPPDKGYGDQGAGEDIPGGATLVFVLDVLGVDA